MAYVAPPPFADGEILTATQMNIVSDDVAYLYALYSGYNMPMMVAYSDVTWTWRWIVRHTHDDLAVSYTIDVDPADAVEIYYNGVLVQDGAVTEGTHTYDTIDISALTVGTLYQIRIYYNRGTNSTFTLNYLREVPD